MLEKVHIKKYQIRHHRVSKLNTASPFDYNNVYQIITLFNNN